MLGFQSFLREQAEGEKLKHIEHLEDHPLNDGAAGFKHAKGVIHQVVNHIKSGKKDASLTMKHDGSPSLVYGHHPENGKFFVASKSAFNKTPKINYTDKDIEKNHGHAPGLVDKLKHALHHLPKVAPKHGVYQGDVLFSGNDKHEHNGSVHFKPNTISYSAPKGSEEGKKIHKAKFGIYTHTQYHGHDIHSMSADYNPDLSHFKEHPDVYHRKPGHDTSKVHMTPQDEHEVQKHLDNAEKIHEKHGHEMYRGIEPHKQHLKTYINHTVRTGEEPSVEGYRNHLENHHNKQIEAVKTEASKKTRKQLKNDDMKHLDANKQHVEHALQMHSHLQKAKDALVHVLSRHTGGLEHHIGDEKVKPEGFVATHNGKVTKLNDRKEFNRLNFLARKQ